VKLTTDLHVGAEVKNAWSCTSTPRIRLHGVVKHRDNLTFTLTFIVPYATVALCRKCCRMELGQVPPSEAYLWLPLTVFPRSDLIRSVSHALTLVLHCAPSVVHPTSVEDKRKL